MKNDTYRILAKNKTISNDTWATGLNNNDLIIGPSGAGKTRGYVKPNILQCSESMIIADTKGSLVDEVGPVLRRRGYRVLDLNFKDLNSACGYNPLDFIRYDHSRGKYNEQDIQTIANTLSPVVRQDDPFWDRAACMYLTSVLAYIMQCLPDEEHSLQYAVELISVMADGTYGRLIQELEIIDPGCQAVQTYKLFKNNHTAERMESSIIGILSEKLNGMNFEGAIHMFGQKERIRFADLGRTRTAVFLTISDTDRSMDRLVSLFYTQALHELCRSADTEYRDHRLPVPVRLILDDFATNCYIPDFQNIISVIRSREIYVSIILQSITQLHALYGRDKAQTILNNCDNCLYLGGQDVETAKYIAFKANRTADTILNMALDQCYLFTRGSRPQLVSKYDLRDHPLYALLAEAGGTAGTSAEAAGERGCPAAELRELDEAPF